MANLTSDVFLGWSVSQPTALTATTTASPAVALIEYITENLFKWWILVSVGLGIPGNFMSLMITLKKDNRRISTCVYMAGLAIVDSFVLLFSEILWKLSISHGLGKGLESNFAFLSAMWYGADGFAVVSGLFLAEMSVDRAIAVIYPMKAATLCTAKGAVKITVTTCVLEMTFMIQTFFVLTLPVPPTGFAIRDLNKPKWFVTFYNYNLLILGTILPFSVIAVCNVIILIGVNRAAVKRKKLKSSTDDKGKKKLNETNLTAMLLMTSLAYLLCSCPKRTYESVAVVDWSDLYWKARYWLGYCIVVQIWTLNFAVNFYVYFLGGGRKFRQDANEVIKKLCCSCCFRK